MNLITLYILIYVFLKYVRHNPVNILIKEEDTEAVKSEENLSCAVTGNCKRGLKVT
jgi:hypothetical protein